MMIFEAYTRMKEQLIPVFGDREGDNIARIYFEDLTGVYFPFHGRMLNKELDNELEEHISALAKGYPVQYLTGVSHFYGYVFEVDPSVLIPRPETEELVHWVVKDHKANQNVRILDIGTGSGCIAIILKKVLPLANVSGMDTSQIALEIARENTRKHDCDVGFIQQDILDTTQWDELGKYEIIVSNPPYVTSNENVDNSSSRLSHEPSGALFVPEDDPLIFYRTILDFAVESANAKTIYFEISEFRKVELESLIRERNCSHYEFRNDLQGKCRMLKIVLKA